MGAFPRGIEAGEARTCSWSPSSFSVFTRFLGSLGPGNLLRWVTFCPALPRTLLASMRVCWPVWDWVGFPLPRR